MTLLEFGVADGKVTKEVLDDDLGAILFRDFLFVRQVSHVIKLEAPPCLVNCLLRHNRDISNVAERAESFAAKSETLDRVYVVELADFRGCTALSDYIEVLFADSFPIVSHLEAVEAGAQKFNLK